MDAKSEDSVILRATHRNYLVVSIWAVLAILFFLLSRSSFFHATIYFSPKRAFEVLALFTTALAVSFWFWLLSLKIAVSEGKLHYRNGFFSRKIPLGKIANIQDEYIPWEVKIQQGKTPRLILTLNNGDGIKINPKPFSRDDLGKMFQILKKAGAWKRKGTRVESLWGYRNF